MLGLLPPSSASPAYTSAQSEDGHRAYFTMGLTHSIPTLAPGMYRHNNNKGHVQLAEHPQQLQVHLSNHT